jgi:hypothetical protein
VGGARFAGDSGDPACIGADRDSVRRCDTALAETHVTAYHRLVADGGDRDTVLGGRYLDRLDKRGTQWRIAVRTTVIEWSGMVPTMPLPFADVPDIYGNGAPARSKADPSYLRPLVNRRDRSP